MQTFKFYTYFHRKATDGSIFYVGKGIGDRAHCHRNRNKHWYNVVAKHGLVVEMQAYWRVEQDALEHEKRLITECRAAGATLCNKTNGGEGVSGLKHSAESIAKMSAAQLGSKHTDAAKAKIGAAGKGRVVSAETRRKIGNGHRGKLVGSATRALLGETGKGRVVSAETRAKISKGNRGKIMSAETRAKIAAAATGRILSADTRAKISAVQKGKVIPEEVRAKISKTRIALRKIKNMC